MVQSETACSNLLSPYASGLQLPSVPAKVGKWALSFQKQPGEQADVRSGSLAVGCQWNHRGFCRYPGRQNLTWGTSACLATRRDSESGLAAREGLSGPSPGTELPSGHLLGSYRSGWG